MRNLTPGNVVTAPRNDVMFVVTEFGLVNLKGKPIPQRATAMISLAHPTSATVPAAARHCRTADS